MDSRHLIPLETVLTELFEAGDPNAYSKSTERANVSAVARLLTALVAKDYPAFGAAFVEDAEVELIGPTEFPFVRRARGPQGIAAMVAHNFSMVSEQEPQLLSLTAQGNQLTLAGRESGRIKATGQSYEVQFTYHFTFDGDKLASAVQIGSFCNPRPATG